MGDYSELSRYDQCNHKGPYKGKRQVEESEVGDLPIEDGVTQLLAGRGYKPRDRSILQKPEKVRKLPREKMHSFKPPDLW